MVDLLRQYSEIVMIKVIFRSVLKDYVQGNSEQVTLDYKPGLTIRAIIQKYGLQPGHIGLVLVDQQVSDLNSTLQDGSTVELYPIFGGG